MNIKNLFQRTKPQKPVAKLKATTHRATAAAPMAEDYDTDEPNVRLSRAFLIVMLLHVVAVGGIFAFSSLKKSTPPPIENSLSEPAPKIENLPGNNRIYTVSASDTLSSIAATYGLTRQDLEKANQMKEASSISAGDKLIIPAKSSAQAVPLDVQKLLQLSHKPDASAPNKEVASASQKTAKQPSAVIGDKPTGEKIYVVQKGDNPVGIAKKQGVKYVDLLAANKITDPKKLQIGQKLIIPQK